MNPPQSLGTSLECCHTLEFLNPTNLYRRIQHSPLRRSQDHNSTDATAGYCPEDEGICMDDDNENLVDLDHISHPGTDPPDDSGCPIP